VSADYQITSDQFFESQFMKSGVQRYDIVFIDGLHEAEQVYRDAINSLQLLNYRGTIVFHDINPCVPGNGSCWKAFVYLRSDGTLDTISYDNNEESVGFLKSRSNRNKLDLSTICASGAYMDYTLDMLDKNRSEALNFASEDVIKEWLR